MKDKFLMAGISLMLILITIQSKAQQTDTIPVPRWEVGVDVLSLFDQNSLVPYSLFGRYLLNPTGDKKSHLRARIGFDGFSYLDTANHPNRLEHDSRAFAFSVMVGYQKEITSTDRSSLYFGSDLSFSRESSNKKWDIPGPLGVQGYEDYSNSKIGLHFLAGYSYSLGSRIRISLESSLSVFFRREIFDQDVTFFAFDNRLYEDSSANRIDSRINPFHQLLFTYKF
jgi:hypothetical protein